MPATTTVRIFPKTRERLARMADERNQSAAELIEELVSHAEDQAMIAQFNEYFSDPARGVAFHASETRPLDVTLADGLGGLE